MLKRSEALDILRASRARVDALIDGLTEDQLTTRSALGGGTWSIKDLIGHLAGWEELALARITGKRPTHLTGDFTSADELNAAEIERKKDWPLTRVRKDAARVRTALIQAIERMDDEQWFAKVNTGQGKSALALVLGQTLIGGRHGPFAHDLAHLYDLERSVKALQRQS
jgi:uncharacterized protein (TIGR03083 family)